MHAGPPKAQQRRLDDFVLFGDFLVHRQRPVAALVGEADVKHVVLRLALHDAAREGRRELRHRRVLAALAVAQRGGRLGGEAQLVALDAGDRVALADALVARAEEEVDRRVVDRRDHFA